ncbi:MAG: iron transporter [Deltaproteobacteria bacterium]|nr:iron transporter [Deltaproteobacteria bacterium]
MAIDRIQIKQGLKGGLRKGWSGFIWIMKILIPVSLFTAILSWTGWLSHLDSLLQPLMSILSLPAIAAFPLLIGMLTNIYAGIAAMAVLPFSHDQMTLMAIFLLIAHNLIQEGIVQAKSGIHPLKATLFRLAAAVFTVIAIAPFFDITTTVMGTSDLSFETQKPFIDAIQEWGMTTLALSIKIFVIIMSILTLLEVLKTLDLIHPMVRLLNPLLKLMGLNQKVGFLWLTAVVFGVAYGGAVIVEEVKSGHLTKEELEELHLSIGINHALVEDPSLFLSLGLNPFWLWVPRIIVAILAERLLTLWRIIKR